MAEERNMTATQQSEPKVARNANGREMSALSYTTIYRQKLKEEQLRRLSESKLQQNEEDVLAKEKAREERRLAMQARLSAEREAMAARNAVADAVLSDVKASRPSPTAQDVPTEAPAASAIPEVIESPEVAEIPEESVAEVAAVEEPAVEIAPATVSETPVIPKTPAIADILIPKPEIRRATAPSPAPAAPAAPVQTPVYAPATYRTAPVEATPTHRPLHATVTIDESEMTLVADPYRTDSYHAVPTEQTELSDVIVMTGDELSPIAIDGDDEDIVFLTDEEAAQIDDPVLTIPEQPLPVEAVALPSEEAQTPEAAVTTEDEAIGDKEDTEQTDEMTDDEQPTFAGEPKPADEEEAEEPAAGTRRAARRRRKQEERARKLARRSEKDTAAEEARLADEAIRAALADTDEDEDEDDDRLTAPRREQKDAVRRLTARVEAERAAAEKIKADEDARIAAVEAQKAAEERAAADRIAQQRATERAAMDALKDAEDAALAEAVQAKLDEELAEQERLQAAREAHAEGFRRLQEQREANELAEDEENSERVKARLDAEARKHALLAAERAERDSERDREAQERAEDDALNDAMIKDWSRPITADARDEEADEDEVAYATEPSIAEGPRRVERKKLSYTRREYRDLAAERAQRIREQIEQEVALWNEEERTEDAYAVLPEGAEGMRRRELRRLFRAEVAKLDAMDQTCQRTARLLRRVEASWMTVRAGFEAIVAERTMIETVVRAIKLARLGKLRGHIRALCARMKAEIRRENSLLKKQKALCGYAPVATDPTMPKALRKKRLYKIPTVLYRLKDDSE